MTVITESLRESLGRYAAAATAAGDGGGGAGHGLTVSMKKDTSFQFILRNTISSDIAMNNNTIFDDFRAVETPTDDLLWSPLSSVDNPGKGCSTGKITL